MVGAPFAKNTASIQRGMEASCLWHCWGIIEAQVALIVAFSSSVLFGWMFLLTMPDRFHMGFRSGTLCLSSLPPDSGPWFPNEMLNLLLSEKKNLDHWATVQFFFSLAQVRYLCCFCFRNGLVALFLKTSERGDSWCTDSSFSLEPCTGLLSKTRTRPLQLNFWPGLPAPTTCVPLPPPARNVVSTPARSHGLYLRACKKCRLHKYSD